MKTKLQVLASLTAMLAFTQLTKAQVISSGTSNNDGTNSIMNVSAADNTRITDNSQSLLATEGYHKSSSSSGSDDAFSGNVVNVGVGFVSGEGNLYTGNGASTSVSPAFELSYEHAIGHIGVGLNISYQTATTTESFTGYNYGPPPTFTITQYSYTDKYSLSLLQFEVRGAYHFSAGAKFDPYVGIAIGYCTIGDSYTTTETGGTNSSSSLSGVEFGGYGGARYFFTDHIGAWIELQYAVASFKIPNTSPSLSVSINPCTVFNLGVAFKF